MLQRPGRTARAWMHQEQNFKARTYTRILQITFVQGPANAELFEGLLMLQHSGQDSAGMDASGTKLQGPFIHKDLTDNLCAGASKCGAV